MGSRVLVDHPLCRGPWITSWLLHPRFFAIRSTRSRGCFYGGPFILFNLFIVARRRATISTILGTKPRSRTSTGLGQPR